MHPYRVPYRDIDFALKELFDGERHYASLSGCEAPEPELLDALLHGAGTFAEEVVAPLLAPGDEEGCRFDSGAVTTPKGFAEAFQRYGEAGWQALTVPVADGGQGLPPSIGMIVNEMVGSANWAWSMYPGLALAPVTCLLNAGNDEQKRHWLPKLLSGEWAGSMCLTEAQCGTDVGLIRTRAVRQDDGSYRISGTKIFVSGGEQDLTGNIVHSILARVEGAPEGTQGISLFLVPKLDVGPDGESGAANRVSCGSIEHKMGLKGSATCVMHFDDATGFLLGEENGGLAVMFKLMNTARLGTATQGLALGERAFQGALAYARERLQMRSLTGVKNPDGEADPILVHPDVRRMLLTQKALTEGQRAFVYWLSQLVDLAAHGPEEERKPANDLLELLTPVAKAFCTETGQEVTNLGLQVFGGHGYIRDNGMEQLVRDGRIATVYEGTTGIQALDLIGRKVMATGGRLLRNAVAMIDDWCEAQRENPHVAEMIGPLADANREWGELGASITERATKNLDELGAASVDFAMVSGYVILAWLWARAADVAGRKIDAGADDAAFYQAKRSTARFYYERLLPRIGAHAAAARAGADTLMGLPDEDFAR